MSSPARQDDLFLAPLERAPVVWSWGVGVDSTAGIIEMHARGEPIDMVLTAHMPERQETFAFRERFMEWMTDKGIPHAICASKPQRFKNHPPYRDLLENCITNATLPSISFGRPSCSLKWKVAAQDKWMENWQPAQQAWAQGMKIVKCIGYDAGGRDSARYAHTAGKEDELYDYRYPLREWEWGRKACEDRIRQELGMVPPKSSCFFCCASKTPEIDALSPTELRLIVLMEARAHPRLRNVEGLWRKGTKGMRGGPARPGSMTEYIRQKGLLPEEQIDRIWDNCPTALISSKEVGESRPVSDNPDLVAWITFFHENGHLFEGDGLGPLFGEQYAQDIERMFERLKQEQTS